MHTSGRLLYTDSIFRLLPGSTELVWNKALDRITERSDDKETEPHVPQHDLACYGQKSLNIWRTAEFTCFLWFGFPSLYCAMGITHNQIWWSENTSYNDASFQQVGTWKHGKNMSENNSKHTFKMLNTFNSTPIYVNVRWVRQQESNVDSVLITSLITCSCKSTLISNPMNTAP